MDFLRFAALLTAYVTGTAVVALVPGLLLTEVAHWDWPALVVTFGIWLVLLLACTPLLVRYA